MVYFPICSAQWLVGCCKTGPANGCGRPLVLQLHHNRFATACRTHVPSSSFLCGDTVQGWVLVWALGSNLPDDDLNFYGPRNQTEFPGNSRLIDPQVIHPLESCDPESRTLSFQPRLLDGAGVGKQPRKELDAPSRNWQGVQSCLDHSRSTTQCGWSGGVVASGAVG